MARDMALLGHLIFHRRLFYFQLTRRVSVHVQPLYSSQSASNLTSALMLILRDKISRNFLQSSLTRLSLLYFSLLIKALFIIETEYVRKLWENKGPYTRMKHASISTFHDAYCNVCKLNTGEFILMQISTRAEASRTR